MLFDCVAMRIKKTLTGFNHFPQQICHIARPERWRDITPFSVQQIARGQGKSYGDAALNENRDVILLERLNRFIYFDSEQGIITAEAGTTLSEILTLIVSKGWFLPVTPGTRHVSLGGCVAADVHGKNHHRQGSFSQHVISIELITADEKTIKCSTQENAEIFWATIGGMGLTGIIKSVSLKLQPINTLQMQVKHYATQNLKQTFACLQDENLDDDYSVAWLDLLKPKSDSEFGRGIVMTAHHLVSADLKLPHPTDHLQLSNNKQLNIPFYCPSFLLNKKLLTVFNHIYYQQQAKKTAFLTDYQTYFYPLDKINNWNRLYGQRGFVQYQCVLPTAQAYEGMLELVNYFADTGYPVFLAVLKRFGAANQGLLSFPVEGFTLALDIPIQDQGLFSVLDRCDEIVVSHGGRVYLAKDARLKPALFQAMYPSYEKWLAIKKQIDPHNKFSSSLSIRLELN